MTTAQNATPVNIKKALGTCLILVIVNELYIKAKVPSTVSVGNKIAIIPANYFISSGSSALNQSIKVIIASHET